MTKTIPQHEKELYEQFAAVYRTLSDLKNNRNKYISLKQVYAVYDDFLRDVHELSIVRKDEELKGMTLALPTPTDTLIDDIWQLLLLLFVTCGLTKFAPATYLLLSTVYKLLTHLKECQVFSVDDLRPIRARLDEIRDIIARLEDADDDDDGGAHKREESLLLRNKLAKCQHVCLELEDMFHQLPADLEPTYAELILVRQLLLSFLTQGRAPKDKLARLQRELRGIEARRDANGRFHSASASDTQLVAAQMVLNGLLDDCNNLVHDASMQHGAGGLTTTFELLLLDDDDAKTLAGFKALYDELLALKRTLGNLLLTRRWTMRETDLYNYQKLLKRAEERRVELNAGAGSGRRTQRAQLLVLYLLRRCYSLIYKLLELSEPVLESLQPIHNQLSTVRRCLLEIKRVDGLNNLRELYPFQFKLALLDNLRQDGKFIVNGQVPEGQGTLSALLAECFDMIYELKIELEEKEDAKDAEDAGAITDEDDKGSDDEVELKRNRYAGFNEADYDMASESEGEYSSESDSEYESNDYY